MKDFTITDADYVDFKKMLHKRKFTYDRQSEDAEELERNSGV